MTYRPGDYFVARTSGPVGAIIRLVTRGDVSHSGWIVDERGRTVEMRAERGGWRPWRGVARYGRVPDDCYVISPLNNDGSPLRDDQRCQSVQLAECEIVIGVRYNLAGCITLALAQNGFQWVPWVRHKLADNRDLFCSQQVDDILYLIGVNAFDDDRPPGNVSPRDLKVIAGQRNWPARYQGRVNVGL